MRLQDSRPYTELPGKSVSCWRVYRTDDKHPDSHATSLRANELVQRHGTYARRVDVALGVGAHSFCECDPRISREIWDKSLHGAISRAPNTDAALYPWVGLLV